MMQSAGTRQNKSRGLVICLTIALVLAFLGWFFRPTPPAYTVTDLGTLPGNPAVDASAINSQGEIVVTSQSWTPSLLQLSAFVWKAGAMTELPHPPNRDVSGSAINDNGQITGFVGGSHLDNQALVFSAGRTQILRLLPGYAGSFGNGINSRGQVVGAMYVSNSQIAGSPKRAFLYSGGRMTLLGLLPGKAESQAYGINTAGQVVGDCTQGFSTSQAFRYDSLIRKMSPLTMPPGYTNSGARAINDKGEVIGEIDGPQPYGHAALWQGGRVKDLGIAPGAEMSIGIAINNQGQAVGNSSVNPDTGLSGFFRYLGRFRVFYGLAGRYSRESAWVYRDGHMADLNALIPARSGWALETAEGINDRGQIVGRGRHRGQARAFLLAPTH